jgi:hypothetical protein
VRVTSRIWLRLAALVATFVTVLLAAQVSRAEKTARTENVTIQIVATAEGNGETLECG